MTPFSTRKDPLAAVAQSTMRKHSEMTLAEHLSEGKTKSSPQVFNFGLHYIEEPDNVERINAFIKRALAGTHIEPETQIRHLFMHLQSIGLVVTGYKGKDGTFDIDQFGKPMDDKPVENDQKTHDTYFPRGHLAGKIKISRSLMPGGRYMVDAEIYGIRKS